MPETAGAEGQRQGNRGNRAGKSKIREWQHGWRDVLGDAARTLAAGSALAFAGWISNWSSMVPKALAFQGEGGAVVSEGGIFEFALRQGGALAVLLVVLWFYRRDYKSLADFWKQSDREKTDLIKDLIEAKSEQSAAMREMSQTMRENTRVIDAARTSWSANKAEYR